jgi:hypothetical protein
MSSATNAVPTISAALVLGALILKGTDLVKYLLKGVFNTGGGRQEGWNGVLTLMFTSGIGVLIVLLFKHTTWAGEITIGSKKLSQLSTMSWVVFGLVAASFGSTLYDLKKAIDNTDTASTPRILSKPEGARVKRVTAR